MNQYIYQADVWCGECACEIKARLRSERKEPTDPADERSYDSDDYPKGPFSDEESDCPEHCAGCGVFLENPLTAAGYDYTVSAIISDMAGNAHEHGKVCVAVEEWAPFYDITTEPWSFDRFDLCQGAYWALADYHGGQGTRAYRRLSILSKFYKPGARESQRSLAGNAQGYYVKFAVDALKRG